MGLTRDDLTSAAAGVIVIASGGRRIDVQDFNFGSGGLLRLRRISGVGTACEMACAVSMSVLC